MSSDQIPVTSEITGILSTVIVEPGPVPQQQQPLQTLEQLQASGTKLTPEQEEELKLRNKYPNPQKPGGSAFIQKMLHKGSKKYFDSGDYNMAKSRTKAALNGGAKATIPNSGVVGESLSTIASSPVAFSPSMEHSASDISTPHVDSPASLSAVNTSACFASPVIVLDNNTSSNSRVIAHSDQAVADAAAGLQTTRIPHLITQQSTPLASANNLSVGSSSTSTSPQLNSSVSSSSLHHLSAVQSQQQQLLSVSSSAQSVSLLSATFSSDKLSTIQLNAVANPGCLLDSEEIGHGIPTPECLPQSRKHSIVQSKLATPRLSS